MNTPIQASSALSTPHMLHTQFPCLPHQTTFIATAREQLCRILNGQDSRLLLIVGPCSIHHVGMAKEYALKLKSLADVLSDTFFVVMRTYFEKPRTTKGWKGILYDPWLDGSDDVETGLQWTRQLLLNLADLQVPTAAEFLDPASVAYFGDLLTWSCIGARTSSSQIHRQMAASLSMPVGFKNNVDGNIEVAVSGVLSAAQRHVFMGTNIHGQLSKIHAEGNPNGHIVLRGGVGSPNYDAASIAKALDMLECASLPKHVLVDCSHDNSSRQHVRQPIVFKSVLQQVAENGLPVRGLLLESYLQGGSQPFTTDPLKRKETVSLTDSCLGWQETEELLKWGRLFLKQNQTPSPPQMALSCAH